MKKICSWILTITCLFTSFLMPISLQADELPTQKQAITSIEKPIWVDKMGMSRGKNHDRQDLGFILAPGSTLAIRQVNPTFKGKLTLQLLNNDNKTEKEFKIGNDWVDVSSEAVSVPFISTPFTSDAEVEYYIKENIEQKELPKYSMGDDVAEFFSKWDQSRAEFSLVKGKKFQLFLAEASKEKMRNLEEFDSLDDLVNYYDAVLDFDDAMSGYDDSTPFNRVSPIRYFLKADIHGTGGAFYSDKWTADSTADGEMWFRKGAWGPLHEFAHGFQSSFDDRGIYTGEVSNNLFAVAFSYQLYGKDADNKGWLFNFGKKKKLDKEIAESLNVKHATYAEMDHRKRLYLLTMVLQKAGIESFTKMSQSYREQANTNPNFNASDYTFPNLMSTYYSENSHFDFTPVFNRWGVPVSDYLLEELHRADGMPAVAMLHDVVPEDMMETAREIIDAKYMIAADFTVIENNDIAELNLKGNLNVSVQTADLSAIIGKELVLKDGATIIDTQTITGPNVTFHDIPNGIYSLEIPLQGNGDTYFEVDDVYTYIKNAENNKTIQLSDGRNSALLNQEITFYGIGENEFAHLYKEDGAEEGVFKITSTTPHNNYGGELYASLEVYDLNGKLVFQKEIEGTKVTKESINVPLKEGYQVKIFHAETKNRLKSKDVFIDRTNKTNTFIVTKYGLENTKDNGGQLDAVKDKIGNIVDRIEQNPTLLASRSSNAKAKVWKTIERLEDPLKTDLHRKYAYVFEPLFLTVNDTISSQGIPYPVGSSITEEQFLQDVEAKTSPYAILETDFLHIVNFNEPGVYQVRVISKYEHGEEEVRELNVHIQDEVSLPTLHVNGMVEQDGIKYPLGSIISNDQFIQDIEASTDEGYHVETNFSEVVDTNTAASYDVQLRAIKDTQIENGADTALQNNLDGVVVAKNVKVIIEEAETPQPGNETSENPPVDHSSNNNTNASNVNDHYAPNNNHEDTTNSVVGGQLTPTGEPVSETLLLAGSIISSALLLLIFRYKYVHN